MKRITSLLLVMLFLLSLVPTAFAVESPTTPAPDKIDASTVWSYLDDGSDPAGDPNAEGYNRTSWTAADFDDSQWETAVGSFGAKNGGAFSGATVQLNGCPGNADNIPTYYFRTTVNVADPSAVTAITGTIAYDDAVILYINGVKVKGFNDDGCDSNSSFCTNIASASPVTEAFTITDGEALATLKSGENVVAVELHNRAAGSSDIYFAMSDMTFSTEALPTANTLLDGETEWTYLDNGSDPAGNPEDTGYDRTSWTTGTLVTDGWKTAAGPFGAKYGAISGLGGGCTPKTLLTQYKEDGTTDIEAYFFRTTFSITSLAGITKLVGTLQYDDAATVYVNGVKIAGFDDSSITANIQYGGSNAGTPKTVSFEMINLSILHEGENTIAVELHQGRVDSSDVWFHLTDLSLSDEEVVYQSNISLSMGADESQMNFTWYSPLENASLTVADNASLTGAQTITAAATVANDGLYSCKATVTGLEPGTTYYYQLSNKGYTSDVYHFTTDDGGAFSFAYVGDPQIGASGNAASDTAGWDNTLNIIDTNSIFSDVSFLLSAGDQVNTASSESEYDGYLDHDALTGLPVATVIGNHDSGSNAYSQHFNVANESDDYGVTNAGGDSYFVYNNVLFLVLNSNDKSVAGHQEFMKNAIKATEDQDISWKVVTFHHSIYTVASHSSDSYITDPTGFKNSMAPIFKDLDIDVVLQGHDHVYCRTYMMDGLTPITESDKYEYGNGENQAPTAVNDPEGILYVTANSGSGSKTYNIVNGDFPFSAVQNQEHVPNVSKVTVSDQQFTITTYRTTDMSVVDTFTIKRDGGDQQAAKLVIDQVYGGGGKSETPISNSFIELYNPNSEPVDLSGYTLVYGENSLALTGTIPANGSYLIVGAEEVTTDELLTYDLPDADKTCDWVINNKSYTITLKNGDTEIDAVTAGNSEATKVSKQKSLARKDHVDTDTDADFQIIVWEKGEVTVDEAYVTAYAPRNSQGDMGKVHGAETEPTYTPVEASDTRVNGYYDETGSLKLELAGRYNSGAMNADGGSLEIVQYNPVNGFAYAVSGVKGTLIAVDLNGKLDGDTVVSLSGTEYNVKSLVEGFAYGDMTSVAISPDGSKLAVAIQAENYADNGVVALFACKADGSLELLSTVSVGVQPDMVTFANNNTILSADEGEPRGGAAAEDPKGSVSIVTIGADNALTAKIVTFDQFDAQRETLTAAGVLVQKNTDPSTDFEPEYIAVSGKTAYVSLQEANAIAVLNIASGEFTGVYPLGFQDYGTTKVDLQKNDTIELENYDNVYGIKMPDGISVTTLGGKTYLLTANEGDSRADWDGLDNESEGKTSPTGNVTLDEKVVWFNATMWDGLDTSKAYVFGGRSFSIYEVTSNGLKLVYDSGSGFEEITAAQLPAYFNTSNDKNSVDNRSGKKGPEPESVITGTVNGRTYAFIALERIGGVMVYDITNPANAKFVNYINSREFETAIQGDVSPEGLCFISAAASKTGSPLLLSACEVSGTLAVYELTGTVPSGSGSGNTGSGSGSSSGSSGTGSSSGSSSGSNPSTEPDTEPSQPVTPPAAVLPFTDVKSGDWFQDAVAYVYDKGMMTGTSATTFAPNSTTTRGMIVTILYRLENEPAAGTSSFADVASGAYYAKAVAWAAENGVVTGTTATTFAPDAPITREQMAAILYRYATLKGYDVSQKADLSGYTDAGTISAYASDAMAWANAQGLITGVTNTTLAPKSSATRAQVATILMRFCETIGQ